ncbi:MAG: hypothetical protein KA419_00440 [Acidobacteria bacterium]|nr:hypothetical protein [Acidobacteriota bacterium]
MNIRIHLLVLFLWGAFVPGQAPGPGTAPEGVAVTLAFPKPLHLVELWHGRERVGSGLEGSVTVTVTNRGPGPVTVYDLDVHGLCFRDVRTGEERVVVHPCDTAFYAGLESPPPGWARTRTHILGPGESCRVLLDDFGCSGGYWAAPPPGEYEVFYRLRTAPPWASPPSSGTGGQVRFNPSRDVSAFRARLLDAGFWKDGPGSPTLRLQLKKPRARQVK